MTKPKTKKKELSIERYTRTIQTDIAELGKSMSARFKSMRDEMVTIRDDMATKKDLERFATKEDIDAVRDRITNAKDELQEQIAGLRYAKEIDALRDRVKRVEKHLGIHHTSTAA
jgi:hypothetical protein